MQELLRKTGSMGQTGEFLIETPQMRLYNPKPRTYKYNIKNSNQRLVQMEKVWLFTVVRILIYRYSQTIRHGNYHCSKYFLGVAILRIYEMLAAYDCIRYYCVMLKRSEKYRLTEQDEYMINLVCWGIQYSKTDRQLWGVCQYLSFEKFTGLPDDIVPIPNSQQYNDDKLVRFKWDKQST